MSEYVHQEQVTVRAPADVVWEVLLDVERWPSWTASMQRVELLDPQPLQVGSRVRIAQPRLPPTVWTVDALDPGRAFSWTSSRPGVRTVADHRVEPADGGSVVTLVLRSTGPLARVSGLLLGALVRRYVRMEAEGLARHAEQRGAR